MALRRACIRAANAVKRRPLKSYSSTQNINVQLNASKFIRVGCPQHYHTSFPKHAPAATNATPASEEYPTNHQPIQSPGNTQNFLDNRFVDSKASSWIDLRDPATNNLVTRVPQSTDEELHSAVESAKKAFPAWRATSLLHKQQLMFKFVALIRENWNRLAGSITLEQGKTFADAKGDVLRGLQVAETACGITTQLTGEVLEVAKDMETRSYKEPLGIVAAICPFSMFSWQFQYIID